MRRASIVQLLLLALCQYPAHGDSPLGTARFGIPASVLPAKSETVLPEDTTGPVTIVKGNSFRQLVLENDKDVLVDFYAPWCGHCKTMMPAYDKLGEVLRTVDSVTIAKMDATANEVSGLEIQGFPTIMFYPANNKTNPAKYSGSRQVENFVKFLQEHATKPFTLPADVDLTPALMSETPSPEDTAGPVVVVKGKSFKQLVVENGKDVLLEVYAPWCGHCKDLAPKYEALGKAFKGVDSVVIAKMDGEANEVQGLDVTGYPTIFFYAGNAKGQPAVKYSGAREVGAMAAFIKARASTPFELSGELQLPTAEEEVVEKKEEVYESEEPSTEDLKGPVKVVKGKTFSEIVLNEEKDVFVDFYAPWCGWCKRVAPVWEELGQAFEAVDSVTIAKMDVTANKAKGVEVDAFPTLLLYPAGDKTKPVEFEGAERTLEELVAFVKKHATKPFTLELPSHQDEL